MPDAYSQLLGIGAPERPLTHYQLLGIDPAEKDPATINAAADVCFAKLRPHATGLEGDDSSKITAEIVEARDTLLDPAARQRYDERFAPAPNPWWKPEAPVAVPVTNAAAVADWWKDLQPSEPAPSAAAPEIQTTSPKLASNDPPTSVAATINSPPLNNASTAATPAAAAWWTDPIEKPAAPAVVPASADWWKDSAAKDAGSTPTAAVVAPPPVAAHLPFIPAVALAPPTIEPLPLPAAPRFAELLPAAPRFVEPLPMPTQPAPAPIAMPEMVLDDDEIRPPDRRSTGSSVLPWLVLGLTILGGSIAAGVWYVNQPDKEPGGRDLASVKDKKDSTPPVDHATNPKRTDNQTAQPANKIEPTPPNVRPPIVVDPGPEKIDEPKPPVKTADFTKPKEFRSSMGTVVGIALSRDGNTFITTNSDKNVMAGETGTGDHLALHRFKSEGVAPAFCVDDKAAVFCDGFEIVIYDMLKKGVVNTFQNPRGGIQCLAGATTGGLVLTGSTDGCIRCWDLKTGKLRHDIDVDEKPVTAVAMSSDGQSAAIGLTDGGISVYDLGTGKLVKRWKGHAGRVTTLALAPSGAQLVSGGEDALGRVWDSASGKLIAKLAGHGGPILCSGWCADGRRVVTAGVDKKVCLWNAETGESANWVCDAREKIFCIAIDSQERFVLAGQSDGIVQLFPLPQKSR